MMNAIVVDLDGTLFNHNHRIDWAKSGEWDEYHSRIPLDDVHADVDWFLQLLPSSVQVIFCTGRNERWRSATIQSMKKTNVILPDAMLMRPDNDFTPDHELKPKLLEDHFGSKETVLQSVKFVLDDRDKVVEAWRNYGLPCWQVRPGQF